MNVNDVVFVCYVHCVIVFLLLCYCIMFIVFMLCLFFTSSCVIHVYYCSYSYCYYSYLLFIFVVLEFIDFYGTSGIYSLYLVY